MIKDAPQPSVPKKDTFLGDPAGGIVAKSMDVCIADYRFIGGA